MISDAAWISLSTTAGLVLVAFIQRNQGKKVDSMNADMVDKLDAQTAQAAAVETKVDTVSHTVNSKADVAAKKIESLEGQVAALNAVLLSLARDVKANGHAEEKPK